MKEFIEELDMSVRSYNCLKIHGINTIKELSDMSKDELHSVRNLGKRGVSELEKILIEEGLSSMKIRPIDDGNSNFDLVELKETLGTKQYTPHCIKHGAMNKVSVFESGGGYWRCSASKVSGCRAGCIED